MIAHRDLTPEERKALGLAVLTTLVTGLASGLVTWGLQELEGKAAKRADAVADLFTRTLDALTGHGT